MAYTIPEIVVVSGIPAGDSGTGRFVSHLQERMTELAGVRIKLIARPDRLALWQIRLWLRNKRFRQALVEVLRYYLLISQFWLSLCNVWFKGDQVLILLHPQNLGYRIALRLIESRLRPPLIFLLDSSFFCIASYNHLKGENGSCLRCLERGFGQVEKNGCKPFPRLDWTAIEFAPRLQELIKAGRVNVAAQNLRQAELAQRQFGLATLPRVVGLWTQDWDDLFSEKTWLTPKVAPASYIWDVLFHGNCLDAKGASWVASVATQCPNLRFMFPFPRPDWFIAPTNCSFVPCTWEDGLYDKIKKSRFVIVPSLWSAPIEGALVKSIACAEAVAVVNNPTSFCDELPRDVVLKLSAEPSAGAEELMSAYTGGWRPKADARARWLDDFMKNKDGFVPDLLDVALGASGKSS